MNGLSEFLKNALFPKTCFGCSRLGVYVCPNCAQKLVVITKDRCVYCGRASFFGLTHPGCQKPHRIDGVKSLFRYQSLLQKIIKNIKYKFVSEAVADFIGTIPQEKITELRFYKKLFSDLVVLPVPLHQNREARRGFNQSIVLGSLLAETLKLSFDESLLFRKKDTKPQAQISSPRERYLNVKGAFTVNRPDTKAGNFIVFDDVWTTGATIKELARLLKRQGAQHVFALTIAG